MGTLLTRKRQIAAKIEAVEGVAETLTAADGGLLVMDPTSSPEIKLYERLVVTDTFSKYRQLPGQQEGRITFRTEVKGSGAAGTPPALGKYLKACGFSETVNAGVSVIYRPITNGIPSMTVGLYTGDDSGSARLELIRGARGSVKFTTRAGEPLIAEFTFHGIPASPTDTTPLSGVNYDNATEPPLLLNANLLIAGFAAKIESLTIDLGAQVTLRPDVSAPEGYAPARLTDRRAVGSFDPEDTLIATHPWYARLKDGTEGALNFVLGSVAGNIVTINAPKVQYAKLSPQERNGIAVYGVDFLLNKDADAGDDELTIQFT